MRASPSLTYVTSSDGRVTVACTCGWTDPLGPVWPSAFDPIEAIVAARAAHPHCAEPLTSSTTTQGTT